MDSAHSGYLLLADVSGYTAFLTQSEQDRAHDILRLLFGELVAGVPAPFRVAEIEGDAVFAYALDEDGPVGGGVLDVAERVYFTFHAKRDHLERNTSCGCIACHQFPALDLKVIIHHGEFILQSPHGGYAPKPAGRDVILAHRLLKNHIVESTGIGAYAALTETACARAGLEGLAACTEEYEHFGEVHLRVHDLAEAWRSERQRRRERVDVSDAWLDVEVDLPVPPAVAWNYVTDPGHKRAWMGADDLSATHGSSGRPGVGTLHRCAHGDDVVLEEVIDWRPFEYVTTDGTGPAGGRVRTTMLLEPRDEGTHLRSVSARPTGRNSWHDRLVIGPAGVVLRRRETDRARRRMERLRELCAPDLGHRGATSDEGRDQ
jgi:uncharacterized protein YndB with AHSA1/START domain